LRTKAIGADGFDMKETYVKTGNVVKKKAAIVPI